MSEPLPKRLHKHRYPPGINRMSLPLGSPEWCYNTIDHAKILYHSYEVSLNQWRKVLGEIEKAKVYQLIPEKHPYGSLDALLKAEIGVTANESCDAIRLRSRGRPKKGEEKGVNNTLMRGTTNVPYLTARIARDYPNINVADYPSVRAAALALNIVQPSFQCPDDPEKAAKRLLRHFSGDRLKTLISCLKKDSTC